MIGMRSNMVVGARNQLAELIARSDSLMRLLPQLFPPCKLAIHMCDARIPLISDIVCTGAFGYCQGTQARISMARSSAATVTCAVRRSVAMLSPRSQRFAIANLHRTSMLHAHGVCALYG